ncbi:MAG: hypothetical protein U0Q16_09845 [Bryobacteraceae bacterium]
MMLFVEESDHIDILIPELEPHKYKHGQPEVENGLTDLKKRKKRAIWKLHGPQSSQKQLKDLMSARDHLCLSAKKFRAVSDNARNVFRIPKPDMIRGFRPVEVTPRIFGKDTSPRVAITPPLLLHDVVCFSYRDVAGEVQLVETIEDSTMGDSFSPQFGELGGSWCLYAQPDSFERTHDTTPMNALLQFRSNGANPCFQLARPEAADKAPHPAKLKGFSRTHLLSLYELLNPTFGGETEPGGCSSDFLLG